MELPTKTQMLNPNVPSQAHKNIRLMHCMSRTRKHIHRLHVMTAARISDDCPECWDLRSGLKRPLASSSRLEHTMANENEAEALQTKTSVAQHFKSTL